MDYKAERESDVNKILTSDHPRRVVVAGPGTGKSFLFEQAIKKEKESGKTRFLAITFIGKLGDALADDLAGLAETTTLHGFARKFVLDNVPNGWEYYPEITSIIKEDFAAKKIKSFVIGDGNYKERTKYYKAVGQEDVMHYAVEICEKDAKKIPEYDLILVDEFQDFNEIEAKLIDLLAIKNKILVVGDDDQALYEFKGSSPKFIRERHDISNTNYESHTLRFCSRCTPVIIDAFHDVINFINKDGAKNGRIKKEYVCYLPEKQKDGDLNQKILLMKDTMPGEIPSKIRVALSEMLREQKVKSVLIIGESRSCGATLLDIAKKLRGYGFKNIDHRELTERKFTLKSWMVSGYKVLAKGANDVLGWRILLKDIDATARKNLILKSYNKPDELAANLPDDFKEAHTNNATVLQKILTKSPSEVRGIADSTIEKLFKKVVEVQKSEREIFVDQLVAENKNLSRPLGSLDITVCSILGSKGLGADVVFVVGFDQGKLPSKKIPTDSEIYQFLVALTRAKKRIYLIHTGGKTISPFINYLNSDRYSEVV
jgi:superfamily I DNA/RNA helicase